MNMKPPLRESLSGLTDQQLKAIGEIIVAGAWLERMIDHSIWVLLGVKSDRNFHAGRVVTDSLRISSKKDLLKRLVEDKFAGLKGKPAETEKAAFKLVFDQVTDAIGKRDSVAHGPGQYEYNDNETDPAKQFIIKFKYEISRKVTWSRTTTARLVLAPMEIYRAGIALQDFIKDRFDSPRKRPTSP